MVKQVTILLLSGCLSISAFAQDDRTISFLKEVVLGDTVYLDVLGKKPIPLDSAELMTYLNYLWYPPISAPPKNPPTDTLSNGQRQALQEQLEKNNKFRWKDLNPTTFTLIKPRKKTKIANRYSLPFF